MDTHNVSVAGQGYLVTYDPSSKKVTKLAAKGFDSPRGLSPFGMDIVPSTHNPDELTIYVINMRPPFVDLDMDLPPGVREAKRDEIASERSKQEGPDPSIEVFRYVLGGDSVQHVATWTDEKVVISPNDVVGLPGGKGAWFTNSLPYRAGIVRFMFESSSPTADSCSFVVKSLLCLSPPKGRIGWVLRDRWMQVCRNRALRRQWDCTLSICLK